MGTHRYGATQWFRNCWNKSLERLQSCRTWLKKKASKIMHTKSSLVDPSAVLPYLSDGARQRCNVTLYIASNFERVIIDDHSSILSRSKCRLNALGRSSRGRRGGRRGAHALLLGNAWQTAPRTWRLCTSRGRSWSRSPLTAAPTIELPASAARSNRTARPMLPLLLHLAAMVVWSDGELYMLARCRESRASACFLVSCLELASDVDRLDGIDR
jgi:hypothetical protein